MDQPDLSKLKVLVADDEPKLRALVAGCVRTLGCETFEARDGDEAWAIAQSRRLDVVVLDVMMPGMSGWEVCRRIKSSAKTARGAAPKVLMLTGIGEHLNEMTSPLFAADAWIDKPFDLEALRVRVMELAEASMREAPPAPPSGPSLKKARPSAELAEEHESVVEPAPPTPAVIRRDDAPAKATQPKKKPKKKPRKKPAPKPAPRQAKRAKSKPVAKKKAAKKKPARKSPARKGPAKKGPATKVGKKARGKKAPRKVVRKKRPTHVKPRKKAPRRGRR